MVKRKGYLLEKIATKENIELGDKNSRKNKSVKTRFYISQHDLNKEEDNNKILDSFKNGKYKTSKYKTDIIYEPKERNLYVLYLLILGGLLMAIVDIYLINYV